MPTTGRTSCQGPKCRTRQRIRRATTAYPPRHSDATDCRGLYLLARVFHFKLKLTVCERCGGTVKVVAALTEPGASRRTRRLIFIIDAIDHTQPDSQACLLP
jgi:hypothetical protein